MGENVRFGRESREEAGVRTEDTEDSFFGTDQSQVRWGRKRLPVSVSRIHGAPVYFSLRRMLLKE
jgi:hypothetical protein